MKATKKSGDHSIGTYRTLSSIWNEASAENIYRLKIINYFRKKISILDTWEGPK